MSRVTPESGLRLIVCTAPPDRADKLARALLDERLIGCCNLIPAVRSLYWWEGAIQDEAEVVMLMETPIERLDAALAALECAHPYQVPKILVFAPDSAHAPYLAWLRAQARG